MTNMKNYGTRTLIGNWYEERLTLEAYEKAKNPNHQFQTRDLTVDLHINANEESPKMISDGPTKYKTAYMRETSLKKLAKRDEVRSRIYTSNCRRNLQGTMSMTNETLPGSTNTPTLLPHQFYDPYKTRFKTIYQKSYNRPEFEAIRGTLRNTNDDTRANRISQTKGSWDPTWKE